MALTLEQQVMVAAYQPLLRFMARMYLGKGVEFGDLMGYGALGLIKAVRTYQEGRGASFGTYARDLIGWAILDGMRHELGRPHPLCISMDALPNPEALAFEGDHADAVCDADSNASLRASIERLPLRHKLVIHGYYLDGVRTTTLAKCMGVSDGRIGQIRREALIMLRRLLLADAHSGVDLGGWQWDSGQNGAIASQREAVSV